MFHAYSQYKRLADQYECWRSLEALDKSDIADLMILHHRCIERDDYALGLAAAWQMPGDLVIIEHDIAFDVSTFRGLLACDHPICSQVYYVFPPTNGVPETRLALLQDGKWVDGQPDYVNHTGIGMVKITEQARKGTAINLETDWSVVCEEVNRQVVEPDRLWHVHYPVVKHFHGQQRKESNGRFWTDGESIKLRAAASRGYIGAVTNRA